MDKSVKSDTHVKQEPLENEFQIKHEPELILEPEELPYPAVTVEETITNDDEQSAEKIGNKLDPNKCYICNTVFKTTKDVQVHLSKHVDMIPYHCSTCTKEAIRESKITSLNQLHTHFRMHASAIKCPECPHRTCTRLAMQIHIQTYHEQSVEYTCEPCGKKFPNKRSLHNHELAHKALDEGQYPCSYCDKKLPCKEVLIRHERIHKAEHELRLQCTQCPQRFPSKSHLKRHHQYVHSREKNFPCQQCGKSFVKKRCLDEHVAIHNKERRYACDMCGTTFIRKQALKRHMLKQSCQLSFGCHHCGMKYRYRVNLAKHEKTHTKSAVQLIDLDTSHENGNNRW